ncbi:9267_t:CDS:2 [Diversispora eburnea]|uniref:Dihydroorotate dehydrogenase (quinone), mitochondrial n=1 Tax=Diversispora eburnea TaxID=1213867 RepID=A0A9N8VB57_9GLOM|nr:9267_t:CDS:2 [Diversispora eburnea]
MPILTNVTDAEQSHKFAIWAGKWKLTPKDRIPDDDKLAVFGKKITNPICLAAGFDKNGEAIDALFDLGFGYVEIGSITPEPQPGNQKPRVFRLTHDKAIINRYGFNSDGHKMVEIRLRDRLRRFILHKTRLLQETFSLIKSSSLDDDPLLSDSLGINRSLKEGKLLAINLGKNKWSDPNSVDDYIKGIKRLGRYADILVINVSSPNTPGLRDLQRKEIFKKLLNEVVITRNELSNPRPALLVKIAPDLSDKELSDIADAVIESNIDGIIVSNTTISRPETLQSGGLINEIGGLSGPPLKPLALNTLEKMNKLTKGKITLIGCGGISNAKDVLEYAKAGATLVQLYTSLSYDGAGKVREIKDELIKELKDQKWNLEVARTKDDVTIDDFKQRIFQTENISNREYLLDMKPGLNTDV